MSLPKYKLFLDSPKKFKASRYFKGNLQKDIRRTFWLEFIKTWYNSITTFLGKTRRFVDSRLVFLKTIKKPKKVDWKWVAIGFLLGLLMARDSHVIAEPRPFIPEIKSYDAFSAPIIDEQPQAAYISVSEPQFASEPLNTPDNLYDFGYCTWYVKNKRPDIPNNWGNAISWVGAAQAIGWPTGSSPKVGAVAAHGNHVAYVEAVEGNSVTVSEMNVAGWNVISSRTTEASFWNYIY